MKTRFFLPLLIILCTLMLSFLPPQVGAVPTASPTAVQTSTDNVYELVGVLKKDVGTKGAAAVEEFTANLKQTRGVKDIATTNTTCPNCNATASQVTWTCSPVLRIDQWIIHWNLTVHVASTLTYCPSCGFLKVTMKYSL